MNRQLSLFDQAPRTEEIKPDPSIPFAWSPSPQHAHAMNEIYGREVYVFGHCPYCGREISDKKAIRLCEECRVFLLGIRRERGR